MEHPSDQVDRLHRLSDRAARDGFLIGKRYLLHDRDPLFTNEFRGVLTAAGVKCRAFLPAVPI
jgi:hypothetical protein